MNEYKYPWEEETKVTVEVTPEPPKEEPAPAAEEVRSYQVAPEYRTETPYQTTEAPRATVDSPRTTVEVGRIEPQKVPAKKEKKGMNFLGVVALALVFSLLGSALGSFITVQRMGGSTPGEEVTTQAPRPSVTTPVLSGEEELSRVQAVANNLVPSVVGVRVVTIQNNMWFGAYEVEGVGSGVIVHEDGYLLTNYHVVSDSDNITVSLYDGREVSGKTVWSDSSMDLAIVKIEADGLTVATMGDSDQVQLAELAIAIGNPLGLEFQRTVTNGIISGLDRTVTVSVVENGASSTMEGLLQTNAAVNSGNSGGPLVNGRGEVIGIVSSKLSSAEGMGFAIPINTVKTVLESIVTHDGVYVSPYMGVSVIDTDYINYYRLNMKLDKGVYVQTVEKNTSADKAGIQAEDILLELGGTPVNSRGTLRSVLYRCQIGDTIEVKLLRNGQEMTLTMTLEGQPGATA